MNENNKNLDLKWKYFFIEISGLACYRINWKTV